MTFPAKFWSKSFRPGGSLQQQPAHCSQRDHCSRPCPSPAAAARRRAASATRFSQAWRRMAARARCTHPIRARRTAQGGVPRRTSRAHAATGPRRASPPLTPPPCTPVETGPGGPIAPRQPPGAGADHERCACAVLRSTPVPERTWQEGGRRSCVTRGDQRRRLSLLPCKSRRN